MILGRRRGGGGSRLPQQFALDTQQLGDAPAFLAVVGAGDRGVERGEAFAGQAAAAQGLGDDAEEEEAAERGIDLAKVIEGGAQQRQPVAISPRPIASTP